MNTYLLQPGLKVVNDRAVPTTCAEGEFFNYPSPSNLNNNNRAYQNTMIIGTAPFMALKGAPADLVNTQDALRPQSTTQFNDFTKNKPFSFPIQDVSCALPLRTMSWEPVNTRAQLQNAMFTQRYCK